MDGVDVLVIDVALDVALDETLEVGTVVVTGDEDVVDEDEKEFLISTGPSYVERDKLNVSRVVETAKVLGAVSQSYRTVDPPWYMYCLVVEYRLALLLS